MFILKLYQSPENVTQTRLVMFDILQVYTKHGLSIQLQNMEMCTTKLEKSCNYMFCPRNNNHF